MREIIALIIAEAAEVERNIHLHGLKKARDHAWKAIYLVNALEFRLFPERKKEIMPLRFAVEQLQLAPEKGLARFWKDWIDWAEIYEMHNKAYSEAMKEIKLFLEKKP